MNPPPLDWQLEEMFGAWNNAVQAIEDLIQVAGTHRAMMIPDKVYRAFFYCEDFVSWAYKLHLTHTFLLVLEIEFKRELHLHHEGYDTDANYNLPQPLKKTNCIYTVTTAVKTSFRWPGDVWTLVIHLHPQWTPMMMKRKSISLQHPWTTRYGLRNLYQKRIYTYIWPQEDQRLIILPKYPPNHRNLYMSQQL